ncbi:MAG: histidine phosphatase family protein [Eubacterium sp.]|nr:histidine phosphatase family protein [Eubacterium sp.]
MKIDIYLIRHGKTKENEEGRYAGCKTDSSLSPLGREELLENIKNNCYPEDPYLIFESPMKRCRETADIIYPEREKIVIEGTEEIDFGSFEGKNYDELNGKELYQKWIDSGGKLPFPEGESIEAYTKRVMKGIEYIKNTVNEKLAGEESAAQEAVPVVFACHGGTIMAARYAISGGEYFDYLSKNGDCVKISL